LLRKLIALRSAIRYRFVRMASRGKRQKLTGGEGPAAPADDSPLVPDNLPREFFTGPGFLALADLVPVMTGFFDPELRLQFCNKALADFLERPRRDMLGRPAPQVMGEKAFEMRRPMLEAALKGERQYFVADFDHPARGHLSIQTEYIPWVRPDGTIAGIVFVIDDVTEQKVAERALMESEARFRRIANSAPVMMWVTRIDRTRDFANDHYVEFVSGPGGSREEAEKLDWRTRLHPDDHDRIVAESIAGEATGEAFTMEARYLRHDGEYRWLRSVSQPRFGPDGELIGFIGVATDITVAKEAELELRRQVEERTEKLAASEAQFRAVFEAALEVMVLLSPDGTVLALNHRREEWRHSNPDEAIGMKFWESPTLRAYPQHVGLVKEGVRRAAKGETYAVEAVMERPGTPTAYLDVAFQPVRGADGEIIYILFEARDITDLKATQEQLRQSQKMEALGQLTGGIAHDFNNLLTVVVGGLDVVSRQVEEPKLKRYATNALAAAERGARLTGQLLAFSRVQRLEVRPVHVAPLIENMRPLLRNVLGPGITKEFELDEEMKPVMADPTQLEVAVLNLAINARDAMPAGGVLKFATRAISVDGDTELEAGDYVELCICDTGVGMPPDVASRAFEPFFTTKEIGKGTGLGLSMVYGMARQSGGTARIESAPGQGTTIKLYLKAATESREQAPAAPAEEREAHAEARSASVLVVDDDPDVRGFMAEALAEAGFTVRDCPDGKCGLDEFAKQRPDLVVLDFVMPAMSGAEVASRMLEVEPEQKILFVSGYSETEAIKRIAPQSPLLTKPFRADMLIRAVRKALD